MENRGRSISDVVGEALGLDPTVKYRASMLPLVRTADDKVELGVPSMLADLLGAFMLPGHVAQGGSYTPEDVTNMAMNVGMMGAPVGYATAPKGAIGMFAGKNAQQADIDALRQAQRLTAEGVDRADIWKNTGWFQDIDGHWKFEIDDSASGLKNLPYKDNWETHFSKLEREKYGPRGAQPSRMNKKEFNDYMKMRDSVESDYNQMNARFRNMNDIVSHPDLFNNYPYIKNTSVMYEPSYGKSGMYEPDTNKISFGDASDPAGLLGLLLHESQHKIQNIEGFAQGSNPSVSGWDDYFRTAGEVEARNVQKRRAFTHDQRRNTPPWTTTDVPLDQIIINKSKGAL